MTGTNLRVTGLAGGLLAVNAIGTKLHDSINSGLVRERLTVWIDAAPESGEEEMSGWTRDRAAEPVSRDQFHQYIFSVRLTTSRTGNHTG